MGRYLIKDSEGRLWARAITRRAAARLVEQLKARQPDKIFLVEVQK